MLHRSSAPQTWTDSAVGASKTDRGEMLFISIYHRSVSSSIKLVHSEKKGKRIASSHSPLSDSSPPLAIDSWDRVGADREKKHSSAMEPVAC